MRDVLIATLGAALTIASAAGAQQRVVDQGPAAPRPGAPFSAPNTGNPAASAGQARPLPHGKVHATWKPASWQTVRHPAEQHGQPNASRWGSKVNGRWWGGANAPGGWDAYRRPYRGYALPIYWIAPRFSVLDWQSYGLSRPENGLRWVRYYDDAVLVDARGSVYDTRSDIRWDGLDRSDHDSVDDHVAVERPVDERPYAAGEPRSGHRERAGDRFAGRGDRHGDTSIAAGAGYSVEQRVDGRLPPPPPPLPMSPPDSRYSEYDAPVAPERAPPPPPPPVTYGHGGGEWRSADGTTTVTTTNGAGGYYRGGYFYPGASTTTVVVQTTPVVTTTTTDYEDAVTYTRARKPIGHAGVKRRRAWRPAPNCRCR